MSFIIIGQFGVSDLGLQYEALNLVHFGVQMVYRLCKLVSSLKLWFIMPSLGYSTFHLVHYGLHYPSLACNGYYL
jgi:hypothetical protein